ncbi:biogenesis of lysosome-related organelles complex 1 subunit 3 isoform X1 [Takifugu rubripes]|uniref:biogenesis of lysosome-related organelles complex 1 subunit 3 isoform X1 n=1 Tax=Takifugu rubripes TaxID=31033 RepID=UPI0005D21066|nr:biogenesis of lysosome-related organelles complex 1 subunit 3 isoform X1 [Takifugu rubripes]|eukprot:XP_003977121.2 PREDICTED: biogenesis of lysosome-related organelles complex 1 subunit 3 isoform X1 [Takifugu rubripes]
MESSYFRISHVIIVFLPHRAMSNRYKTVVQGEASETDSDDEVYITSMPPPQAALVGLKVSGEASETDSDGDEEQLDQTSTSSQQSSLILQRDLPPLIVVQDRPDIQSVVEDRPSPTHRPHGETLLQQKLQESNTRLYHDIGEMVRQLYSSASKEVHSATAQLNASQGAIINASHSIRIILDDLKAVSEKIDIITSCQILPDINITN